MGKYCETKDNLIIVRLNGDLDHHVARDIKDEVDGLIVMNRINRVAFDFKNVSFMDSSGIGLIMGRYALMQRIGGELCLKSPNERVMKILKLAGLDRIIKIEEGEENEKRYL